MFSWSLVDVICHQSVGKQAYNNKTCMYTYRLCCCTPVHTGFVVVHLLPDKLTRILLSRSTLWLSLGVSLSCELVVQTAEAPHGFRC